LCQGVIDPYYYLRRRRDWGFQEVSGIDQCHIGDFDLNNAS
jgi:hypothetical protein